MKTHAAGFIHRAERRQARARFRMDLGATRLDRDRTGGTSGNLARLEWSQQLTSVSTAGIQLAREYLDAGTVLLSTATSPTPAPGAPPSSSATGEVTNDFFYTKRAEAYYNRSDSSYGLSARAYYRDLDYEMSPQDRQEAGGRLMLHIIHPAFWQQRYTRSYLGVQYQSITRDDRRARLGSFLYRRLNRESQHHT